MGLKGCSLQKNSGAILVTGGAGYIGSHTVLALRGAGYDVVVVDNLSTGRPALVPEDVPLIIGEVADQDLISRVLRQYSCLGVLHFAGSISVPESITDPYKYYTNNSIVSSNLIGCCVAQEVNTFVFSSTAAVYGSPEELPVSECMDTKPVNPYGSSKLMTEWMLRDVSAASNLSYAALRYFNVAGADPQGRSGQAGPSTTHLIRVACEVATGGRSEFFIFGEDYDTFDGTCIRDFIHVSDLATAHVLALQHLLENKENLVLNCGYGRGYSVREVLDVVQELAGSSIVVKSTDRRKGDVAVLISDSRKIRDILKWTPQHDDLRAIVRTALEWEMKMTSKGRSNLGGKAKSSQKSN